MPSPSLFLGSSTTLVSVLALLSAPVLGDTYYKLDKEISGSGFFDEANWNYFTGDDPTHGYVDYLGYDAARAAGLIQAGSNAYMGVDYTNQIFGRNRRGRPSVRIESKQSWTKGLFVTKIDHMPGGICGTWPAFWTLSSKDWPSGGEIDIIEGANINKGSNVAALHTLAQCSISGDSRLMSGTLQSTDCKYYPGSDGPQGNTNAVGCGITDNDMTTFGNQNQFRPQVFAMEWTSDAIKIWSFPQGQVPADIDTNPDPSKWGLPSQTFNGPNCNIDAAFSDHRMIFDTTFCGDWAGGWSWDNEGCAASTGYGPGPDRCAAYVAENPAAFQEAYWSIGYVRVFQKAERPVIPSTTTTMSINPTSATIQTSISTSNPVSINPTTFTTTTSTNQVSVNPTLGSTTTTGQVSVNPTLGTTTTTQQGSVNPTIGSSMTTGNPIYTDPVDGNTWLAWTTTTTTAVQSAWSDWSAASTSQVVQNPQPASTWADWSTWAKTTQQMMTTAVWSDWEAQPTPSILTQAVAVYQVFGAPAGGCPDCNYENDKKHGFDNGGIIPGPKKGADYDSGYNDGGSNNDVYTVVKGGNDNGMDNNKVYDVVDSGKWNNANNNVNNNAGAPKATNVVNGNGSGNGNGVGAAVPSQASSTWAAWTTGSAIPSQASSTWAAWSAGSTSATKAVVSIVSSVPSGTWGAWAGTGNGTYSGPVAKYTGGAASVGMSVMAVMLGVVALAL